MARINNCVPTSTKEYKNSGWILTKDEQKIVFEKYKSNISYNVYRSLEQCIDGFIDAGILGHCTIFHNLYSSTFDDIAIGIFNLFFCDVNVSLLRDKYSMHDLLNITSEQLRQLKRK